MKTRRAWKRWLVLRKKKIERLASLTLLCLPVIGAFGVLPAIAQEDLPTPTPEQLEILKNLPAEDREALMEQVLGDRKSGVDKQDRKLKFPRTTMPRRSDDTDRKFDPLTGEPRLRGNDTLIVRLEIREFTGPDEPPLNVQRAQQMRTLQTQQGQQSPELQQPAVANPIETAATIAPRERIQRLEEEVEHLEEFRDRILRRNPYRLDKIGVLQVPELGPIPLAGLTVEEARQRLAVEGALKDFRVDLTLLPLEPTGEQALKPFGYDLFDSVPTTFAPATDIPVPADYVVGPGDQVQVQLFGNINKTYSLIVGREGNINFPQLGPINVGGQLFSDVRRKLEERISSQMIGVRANVNIGDTRSIRVFVLGEAERPGSYTVSGLSTITNALFASGGVKPIGSLRNIQLKRRGETVGKLDLYDLLLSGDTSADERLLPGDVIFIPPVGTTVSVMGQVRRPAIYELRDERTPAELVSLAGGLMPDADPRLAKLDHINEHRQRVVLDVDLTTASELPLSLSAGDLLRVQPIRSVQQDMVLVQGHVYRPGSLQYRPGMRLSDALNSLDELKPQADTHYVLIRRESSPEKTISIVSADLARAIAARGSAADIPLQPRDRITVFDLETSRDRVVAPLIDELRLQSKLDRPMQVVGVGGRVKAPGQYPMEPNMRISDLIRAGGSLDDAAYGGSAELVRYKVVEGEYRQTELIEIDLASVLRGNQSADVLLEPYDFLNIKELPQWRDQEEIEILGEVRFPGKYPIQRGETLRSLLTRAGGLTDLAFPEGGVFLRKDLMRREQEQIESLARRMQSDISVLALQATQANVQSVQALTVGQALLGELRNTKAVGRLVIDLKKIIAGMPGADVDLVLKNGDRLLIPKKAQEVTVLGEVQTTTSHLYRGGLTRDDYIGLSGGPTQKADKRRIYVVRADGSVVAGGSRWFQRSTAQIRPGDSIVVPLDAERMRPLPLWAAVTQILYNVAIAAAAVNSF